MAKLLKITKADKTTHTMPLDNKAFYLAYNNRLPADQKWTIEEIDEKDAKDLPFIDEKHVTPADAVVKAKEQQKELEAKNQELSKKDQELEELRKQLAAQQSTPKFSADELIALIGVAKSVEQVDNLAKDEKRTTVIAAADKRKAELSAK